MSAISTGPPPPGAYPTGRPVALSEWPRRGFGVVVAGLIAVEVVNEIVGLVKGSSIASTLIPISVALLGLLVVSLPGENQIDRSSTLIVLIAATVNMVIVTLQTPVPASAALSDRHLWASTVLLLVLALRGRVAAAWLGMLVVLLLQAVWVLTKGAGDTASMGVALGGAGLLMIGTLFLTGVALTQRRASAAWEIERLAIAEQEAVAAVLEARKEHTDRLLGMAGPLLLRISEGKPLSAEERLECLLVEGSLRDAARAPGLAGVVLSGVVREARRRGVQVTLFDDRHDNPLTPAELTAVSEWIMSRLSSVAAGSFTARLLPVGRGPLATVVISRGDEMTALEFPAASSV